MVDAGIVCCGIVTGVTMGGSLFMYNSSAFARDENRRVEAQYREICEKYEGLTGPGGVKAFKGSMVAMFKEAQCRAGKEGWFIYPGMRRMLKKDWQADLDVLEGIDPLDDGAYENIKGVFKATGQWANADVEEKEDR